MNWISVKDKLPPLNTYVLICAKGNIIMDRISEPKDGNLWDSTFKDYVTHWMPLPNPPNETDDLLNEIIREGNERMAKNTWIPNAETI